MFINVTEIQPQTLENLSSLQYCGTGKYSTVALFVGLFSFEV